MKKLLIASAALAMVAGTAQAQSSVTLYGIIDSGVVRMDNSANSTAAMSGGVMATSRWGVRGTEDLGGGLTAGFNFEGGLLSDTGEAVSATRIFDRQSNISLTQKGIGQAMLGRTTRLDFDAVVAHDPFGAANFGGANAVVWNTLASVGDWGASSGPESSRFNNSIKLSTDRFSGFQVSYQHSLGEVADNNSGSRSTAYSVDYTAGKAKVTYAASQVNASSGAKTSDIQVLGATYDFGVARVSVGMGEKEKVGDADKIKTSYIGAVIPVNSKVNALVQASQIKNADYTANANADVYALGATYAFSKRTSAYAVMGKSNNDAGAKVSLGTSANLGSAVGAGLNQTGYGVGLRHNF